MKKRLLSLLQIALGLGLIAFLVLRMENRGALPAALRDVAGRWPLLAAAVAGFFGCIMLCCLRWRWLLGAQGLDLPLGRVTVLYYIGQFFNSAFPGVVGGDLVKAYLAARETHHRKTEAVATVFIDRIIGMFALIAFAAAIMLCRLPFFLARARLRAAMAFMLAALLASALGLVWVFRQDLFERSALLRRLRGGSRLGETARRAYEAFRGCLGRPEVLVKTGIVSLGNHALLIVCVWCLGLAVGLPLGFADYLTVFPVINSVSAIPLTPGGLGTREAATVFLLGELGVPEARAVVLSLLVYAVSFVHSLAGGLVYLVYTWGSGAGLKQELRRLGAEPEAGAEPGPEAGAGP